MLAPMLVQMERQIDREIAADNKAMGISVGCGTDNENGVNSISVGTDGNDLFESDSEDEEEDSNPMLIYGPQPQIITNDLKSLDEMVSQTFLFFLKKNHFNCFQFIFIFLFIYFITIIIF